jgi:hypothetical protein
MPSVLLPQVALEQERMEREIQAKRRAEQENQENRVIDFLIASLKKNEERGFSNERGDYLCMTYEDYGEYIRDTHNISAWVWNWFGLHDCILHDWDYAESNGDLPLYIVYKDSSKNSLCMLEDLDLDGEYSAWKERGIEEFFKCNSDRCFIIRFTGDISGFD